MHSGAVALLPLLLIAAAGPGETRATLRLHTDPGGPAWAMDRAIPRSLVWIFDGLRQHVRRSRYD